ncbi:hypothetical protein [Streptacidiphilus sp. MAP5-3]|uniref:hypothetical protein n=1 Tax=unclassified Streptacidiphilus TaxID=2643834 RepID=UPI003514238B
MTNTQPSQLTTDARPAPSLTTTAFGLLAAAVAVAFAGWVMLVGPLANLPYDVGHAGTPGSFTATKCWTTGGGKSSHNFCDGTFTSTDGSVVVRDLQLEDTRASVGHSLTVRREADGTDYAQPGLDNAAMDVALCLLILVCLGCALAVIGGWPSSVGVGVGAGKNRTAPHGNHRAPGTDEKPKSQSPSPWWQIGAIGFVLVIVTLPLSLIAGVVGFVAKLFIRY